MSKRAMAGCGRRDTFLVDPDDLVLVKGEDEALFDKRALGEADERLVLNIMAIGVHTPVIARKVDGEAVITAGRRRVLAAREANRRAVEAGGEPIRVPTLFVRGDDARMLAIMASENELREDDNPLERARKAARLLGHGHDEEAIGVFFGVQKQTVMLWLRVLDNAHQKVLGAVEKGSIGLTAASKIAKLSREKQAEALTEALAKGKASTRDVERTIAKTNKAAPTRSKPKAAQVRKVYSSILDPQLELGSNGARPSADAKAVLGWVLGTVEEAEAVKAAPWLGEVLKAQAS